MGAEAKLQLVTNGDYLVALQSTVDENKCIGVNNDGTLKSCSSADPSALFGVILIVRILRYHQVLVACGI